MFRALSLAAALLVCSACTAKHDERATGGSAEEAAPPSLNEWMTANARPAVRSANHEKLVEVFQRTASFAPKDPQFLSWKAMAESGATAAANGDIDGARKACRACHEAHRTPYQKWARGRH